MNSSFWTGTAFNCFRHLSVHAQRMKVAPSIFQRGSFPLPYKQCNLSPFMGITTSVSSWSPMPFYVHTPIPAKVVVENKEKEDEKSGNYFSFFNGSIFSKFRLLSTMDYSSSLLNFFFSGRAVAHCEYKSENDIENNLSLPPNAQIVYLKKNDSSLWQVLIGALCQILILCVWIGGLALPLLLIYSAYYITSMYKVFLGTLLFLQFPEIIYWLSKRVLKSDLLIDFFTFPVSSAAHWFPAGTGIILDNPQVIEKINNLSSKEKPSLLCIHPHGIITMGVTLLSHLPISERLKMAIAPILAHFNPLMRLVMMRNVEMISVNAKSLQKEMIVREDKRSIGIVPGGFNEATITKMNTERLYLKKRKGFVKYSLRGGYDLIPVYLFGESNTYHNLQGAFNLRLFLNRAHIPTVLFFGHPLCPVLPKRVPLMMVVGEPIPLPHIPNPTKEDVEKYHKIYCQELEKLFNKYKHLYFTQLLKMPKEEVEKTKNLEIW